MKTINLFAPLPDAAEAEVFESLLATPAFRLERIVSHGQCTADGAWYDQPDDEWVVLLRGSARLSVEGEPGLVALNPGDCILLPAHTRHRVEWTDPDTDTVWLALHFSPP